VKRFLKVFALLIVSLFLVASGVDAALDHFSHSSAQSSFSVYDEKGATLFAYDGDLNTCKAFAKPTPVFLHRT
jgi:hypothetical protein